MTTFKYVSITAQDISTPTKNLLLAGHASYAAVGACDFGLFFTKKTLLSFLEEDFLKEDGGLTTVVLEDIGIIVAKMEEDNANFLFLN